MSEESVSEVVKSTDIKYVNIDGTLELYVDGIAIDLGLVRTPEVASKVSTVAKYALVREWMVDRQCVSSSLGNVVMEGRDIGTVVFPKAKFKFFITATPEERARRRLAQPGETVDGATLAKVAADIAARDKMDSERKVSPLKPADDAIIIDSTEMTIEDVVAFVIDKVTA